MGYTVKMICFEIFVDSTYFIPNIYIVEIFQYMLSTEMIFVVIHILKEFLDERKKDNQLFVIFVVFEVKQSVGKMEKISEFRSF